MKKYTIKIGMLIIGWACIGLGIIGIFLPFLQGFIFLAIGAFILSRHSMWFAKKLAHYKARHPAFARAMNAFEARLGNWTKPDAAATIDNLDPKTTEVTVESTPPQKPDALPIIR